MLSEQAKGMLGMTTIIPCNNKYILNQRVAELRLKNGFNSLFMTKVINNKQSYFEQMGAGTKVQNITKGHVENCMLFVPQIDEQIQIGEFFFNLDNLITLHQRKHLQDKNVSLTWEQRKVADVFKVTRGYVLAATETSPDISNDNIYPVYSSQTKNEGLMGYYSDYLYEDAITWTTDGANAGTVKFRKGKFYCTNVCGVLLSNEGIANKAVAEALNAVAWKYVSHVGNPKLMNNVMSEIEIMIPKSVEEQLKISEYLDTFDNLITLHRRAHFHRRRRTYK